MRPTWRLAAVRDTLRRNWRVRGPGDSTPFGPPLVVRPLEERRVLSVSPAVALAIAAAGGETDVAQAVIANPDPATPLGTDAAHQTPIDPGQRDDGTNAANDVAEQPGGDTPAAEELTASDNASAGEQDGVAAQVETSLEADGLTLDLMVTSEPPILEGSEVALLADFTDTSEGGAESYTFTINWGDGSETSGNTMIGEGQQGSFADMHHYADNGVYTVMVTLTAGDRSVVESLEVIVDNVTPSLVVPGDQVIDEGDPFEFTAAFTDPGFDNADNPEGEVEETFSFVIEWGDGTFDLGIPVDDDGGPGVPTSGSFTGQHLYAAAGVYTVRVTISDDDGGTTFREFTVTVNAAAPTLTLPENQETNEGDLFQFTADFTDPHEGGAESYTFTINWGDGSETFGETMIGEGQQGSFVGMHHYADNGVYTVTVTLFADDRSVTESFLVTVHNVTPSLVVPGDQVIDEGDPFEFTSTFTDPGFDNPDNPEGEVEETFSFVIEWGDGTFDLGVPVDNDGGPGVPTSGSFTGQHLYAAAGVYTVRVTISDDDGGTTFREFTVTVNAAAPTLTLPENQETNEGDLFQFTADFTDPHEGGAESYTFTINWGDGSETFGETMIGEGQQGSFVGMHHYADNGVYTVTVTLFADDRSVTESFLVTVHNVTPSLTVPGNQVIDEGDPFEFTSTFTDPGFDNADNPEGEVEETFSFVIEWGDGTFDLGVPVDNDGGPGVPTSGSFAGQHLYAAAGVYTVRVTISDDDGGTTFREFTVTVRANLPIVTVPEGQVLNEGDQLEFVAQFIDLQAGGAEAYSYTIDWGDGHQDPLMPASGEGGGEGFVQGSFGGAHIYADNGLYTVVVTFFADSRQTSASFGVIVNNVAPALVVVGDQTIPLGVNLTLANLGQFTDPGFDNPSNPEGEVAETFTFVIEWGDANSDFGLPATQPGGPNVATSGSFDGQHLFGAPGVYTVTATVSDDDGGTAQQTFTVTVFVLQDLTDIERVVPGIVFAPGGGGGTSPPPPVVEPAEVRPAVPQGITRLEFRRAGTGSVAGAEPRLVLRIVTPAGIEDLGRDELLPDETLDNLRQLFRRLPDGHYRIYLIQPDGVEILVVDVIVRQGRNIDAADEPEGSGEAPPQADTPPVNEAPKTDEASADKQPVREPPDDEARTDMAAAALALGVGYAAYGRPFGRLERARRRAPSPGPGAPGPPSPTGGEGTRGGANALESPRFDKVRRLMRRLR